MGYPMALNLLKGLGAEKTLLICDVSSDALARFQEEAQGLGTVKVVQNGFEAAKAAVRNVSKIEGVRGGGRWLCVKHESNSSRIP